MIDAGDSQVILEWSKNYPIKYRYFVCGIGSGIAKRFKDPAQMTTKDKAILAKRSDRQLICD